MTRPEKLEVTARQLTSILFAQMMNPANRGPALKWADLPEFAAERIECRAWLYFVDDLPEREDEAVKTHAAHWMRYLMRESGLDDFPSPKIESTP